MTNAPYPVVDSLTWGVLDAHSLSNYESSKKAFFWLIKTTQLLADERLNAIRIVLSGRFDATDETQWKKFADGGSKTKEVTL